MTAAVVAIRPARIADVDGVLALERHFPGDRMSRAALRRLLRSPSARLWVAQTRRPAVIAGAIILLTRANSGVARIYSLVVDPELRGFGLGRRLVGTAERAARSAGLSTMSLEVREDNAAARALYARLGYCEHARLSGYYEDGAAGLRLRKAL